MKKLFYVIIVVGLVVAIASLSLSAKKDIPPIKKQLIVLDKMSTSNFAETKEVKEAVAIVAHREIPEKPVGRYIAPPPDPNIILQGGDDCATATLIPSLPYTDAGTTAGYTDDYDEVCPYEGSTAPDVVYSYVPEVDTCIEISLCNSPTTDYDTKLYVYEDECVSPYHACNDDWSDCYFDPLVSALFQVRVYAGHTYYIVVDGYDAGSYGNYTLTVDYDECPSDEVPPNDSCENAEPIVGPYPASGYGTCINATVDCPGVLDWAGVWYTIDLPYECNDINIVVCGEGPTDLNWIGIVLMDDCLCDDYILRDEGFFFDCPNGYTGYDMNFYGISGPVIIYWPAWVADVAEVGIDFSYTVDVTECGVCDVTCPPGGIDEGEPPCSTGYVDNYNGGCNSTPYVFSYINADDTICGTSGTYLVNSSNFRDTDWFELVLTESKELTWCAVAEFPVLIFIIDGTGGCDGVILTSGTADLCDTVCISYTVPAGTYWMWVGPQVFTGWDCPLEYVAWLDVEEPPIAPPNDLCEDAEYIPGPYPDTVWGTRVGATIDCPGVLDWDAVWYYFDAPYASNRIELNFCPTGDSITYDITNGGIVLFNEPADPQVQCPDDCADYLSAATYGGYEFPLWCPDQGINAYRVWWTLPGPAIYYLPVYLEPGQFGFGFEIDVTEVEPAYCDACYSNTTDDYIANVTFNTINNTTGFEGPPCSYGDYTALSTDICTYETHTLTVSVWSMGMYVECIAAFIDWNQDLDWDDPGERYDLGCGIDPILSMDITVPFDALLGPTRMRVIEEYSIPPANACPNTFYGETEDYTVNICAGISPEFSVDPTSIEGEAAPGSTDTAILSVSNVGPVGSVLNFTVSVTMNPLAAVDRGPAPEWTIGDNTYPDAALVNTSDAKVPYQDIPDHPITLQADCPEGTIFSQAVHYPEDSWQFANSDIGSPGPYLCYDNFMDAGMIEGIHFWAIDLRYDAGWYECFEDPMTFEIIFYEDAAGFPGAVIASYIRTINPVPTGMIYLDFAESNEYTTALDPIYIESGWVSIQGISDPMDCWFMWGSARELHDEFSYQWDGTSLVPQYYDRSFCLLGEVVEPWLSIDVTEGSIPSGDPPIDITVTMNAADLDTGTYTGSVDFSTNDPNNLNPSVPVTFVVTEEGVGCDYVPGDANGDGQVMGNDVTYSVRYFKGLGPSPPDSCEYDGGWLYSGGDANGSCSYTGADVTFLVAYFKGYNPAILWCPDTPPIGGGLHPAVIRGDKAITPKSD